MGKTKAKEEAVEGQAAGFADRLSKEREKTAFGTPTKSISEILLQVQKFLDSGAYKQDRFFKAEWTKLHYELTQLYDKANGDLVVAAETGNTKKAESQQELLNILVPCMDKLALAGGATERPSAIAAAREQPPQLGKLVASPRVFTGKVGAALETTLPDQFQQGIAEADQEAARLRLQSWFEAYEKGGDTAKAGREFYNFLKSHVGTNQLNAMLCGTAKADTCNQIKKLFENGDMGSLLHEEYPISETLRRTLKEASRTTRYIVSNVTVSSEAGFKLGEIGQLGVRAGGEYQTALTRRTGATPAEKYEHLFGAEIGPFGALQLGPATQLKGSAGIGYGQLERGVFFPAELKISTGLGTTAGTALFFDIYGRGKFGLDLKDFRQMQVGTNAYLVLFQVGERQFGIFTSADVMNVKGKSQEFTFDITNLQLNLGPQAQFVVNGWLVALQAGPSFVFPIKGAGGETTYGLHLGTMFQKGDFRGGIDVSSPNLFNSSLITGNPENPPLVTGNLMLGFTFGGPKGKR